MSPAASKAQQAFFGLVDKVQKGQLSSDKVSANVRQAAKNTSKDDVRDILNTPGKDLPDRTTDLTQAERERRAQDASESANVVAESPPRYITKEELKKLAKIIKHQKNEISALKKSIVPESGEEQLPELDMTQFENIVSRYNEYGRVLQREHRLSELAQQLASIAEYAEHALTNEAEDWYDAHTVKRNVKEMKKYAQDFAKVAQEADMQQSRLQAYYEDMGRILERYFNISKTEDTPPSRGPVRPRERQLRGPHFESIKESLNENAVKIVSERLTGNTRKKFESLSEDKKVKVAWRIL